MRKLRFERSPEDFGRSSKRLAQYPFRAVGTGRYGDQDTYYLTRESATALRDELTALLTEEDASKQKSYPRVAVLKAIHNELEGHVWAVFLYEGPFAHAKYIGDYDSQPWALSEALDALSKFCDSVKRSPNRAVIECAMGRKAQ